MNLEEETVPVKAVIFTAEDAEVRGGNRKMGGERGFCKGGTFTTEARRKRREGKTSWRRNGSCKSVIF